MINEGNKYLGSVSPPTFFFYSTQCLLTLILNMETKSACLFYQTKNSRALHILVLQEKFLMSHSCHLNTNIIIYILNSHSLQSRPQFFTFLLDYITF